MHAKNRLRVEFGQSMIIVEEINSICRSPKFEAESGSGLEKYPNKINNVRSK